MGDARRASSTKLLACVGGPTLVAVAATFGASTLIAGSPRGFSVNAGTAFLGLVETVIGLFVAGVLARRRRGGPGGVATPVLLAAVVIDSVLGFVTIGAYSLVHDQSRGENWVWAAILAESAAAFVVAGVLWRAAEARTS